MLWDNLAIVDVETTGGFPPRDRVIEIGIITIDFGRITHTYSRLVNPARYLPPEITRLTGIAASQLETAPRFDALAKDVFLLLQNRLFVAHNARFDVSFIKSEFNRLGFTYTPKHLCSARLSRRLFPHYRHHSLDSLIDRFQLTVDTRHRALDDARAIWDFFLKLPDTADNNSINAAVNKVTKKPSLPLHLKTGIIDSLPPAPGVYIFYNREHFPLYIGKSVNVKDRIMSHFYSDLDSPRERSIKQDLVDIDVVPAAGDLEAQLIESKLVKNLQPIYNRQLRVTRELVALTLKTNADGYLQVELTHLDSLTSLNNLYGLYKSKKHALQSIKQLVEERQLCWRLSGLESGTKACFGYHLGSCLGACRGLEPPAKYNLRVLTALGPQRFLDWPFPGPIAITEKSSVNHRQATHFFNRWQHLGTTSDPDNTPTIPTDTPTLNLDIYKILKRYLQKHPHRPKLIPMSAVR